MASLIYLWGNRAKFSSYSIAFYKAWAKRFLSLPDLVLRNNRRSKLVVTGAVIDERAEIGKVQVEGNIQNLTIGPLSTLGRVYIVLHDKVCIGERVCINDGVKILTASHDVSDPGWSHTKKEVIIDDYAWIGTNALILPGVRVGRGAVVGAGAVVSKSVPPGIIVVGNPARPIRKKRSSELNYNPCESLAANRAWLVG